MTNFHKFIYICFSITCYDTGDNRLGLGYSTLDDLAARRSVVEFFVVDSYCKEYRSQTSSNIGQNRATFLIAKKRPVLVKQTNCIGANNSMQVSLEGAFV